MFSNTSTVRLAIAKALCAIGNPSTARFFLFLAFLLGCWLPSLAITDFAKSPVTTPTERYNANGIPTVPASDSLALVALYNSTNGTYWIIKTNWLTGPVNTWYGVTVMGGRVTSLLVYNNHLNGSIPIELGNLSALQTLHLHSNNLSGNIPASVGKLTSLESLSLDDNQLSGSIPAELGDLSALKILSLGVNRLSGSLPAELGNLSALKSFFLSNNQLSGSLPTSLGKLTALQYLDLSYNQLSGSIPAELGNLIALEELSFYENQLSGSLPAELGNLSVLQTLNLSKNQLSGSIPENVGNLPALSYLELSYNQFISLPLFSASISNGLYVNYNRLTFESLELNKDNLAAYSPQDSVGAAANPTISAGQSIQLSALVGGANNHYHWTKNGVDINGATNASLTVNTAGAYGCNITNTVITGLTLNRRRVNVSDEQQKKDQTISFYPLSDVETSTLPFALEANTSSGLAVTYTSSNTGVATVSGNTITIVGAGTTTITASQAGNADYLAATPVSRPLNVNKARLNQTITFAALPNKTLGEAPFTLKATASSGLPITYYSSNHAVATISGDTVTIVGLGNTLIVAYQYGDETYYSAVPESQPLEIIPKADTSLEDHTPVKAWSVRYNGTGNGIDQAVKSVLDAAGNLYVVGTSDGDSSAVVNNDIVTIKYNAAGVQQWMVRYNGSGNGEDVVKGLVVDAAGNVYITGGSTRSGNGLDITTIKYNAAGVQQWVQYFDMENKEDVGNALALDAAGNVYVTGYSTKTDTTLNIFDYYTIYPNKDYTTLKYTSTGVQQWVQRYGSTGAYFDYNTKGDDIAVSIVVDAAGNASIAGTIKKLYNDACLLIRYNTSGVQQWQQEVVGSVGAYPGGLALDPSGNICISVHYVPGAYDGNVGIYTILTAKYTAAGNRLWWKDFGDWSYYTGSNNQVSGLVTDAAGNIYIIGSRHGYAYLTIKYNASGVEQWVRTYKGTGTIYNENDKDYANALAVDANGNVYLTGAAWNDAGGYNYTTIQYNATGTRQWVAQYNGSANGIDSGTSLALGSDGSLYVTGNSYGGAGNTDWATVKYVPKSASTCQASGTILREVWTNLNGSRITDIPLLSPPNQSSQLTSLQTPANFGDRYGQRLRGYICAPQTGAYTFWLVSDNDAQLFLSTDADHAHKQTIAFIQNGYALPGQWTKYPSQKSATINLVAGQQYYLEAIHKEEYGGDNLIVGWRTPVSAANAIPVIVPGSVLSPFIPVVVPVCAGTGSILREYWANVKGDALSNIPVNTTPTSTSLVNSFEGLTNVADKYAARYRGYLCAPTTGQYRFAIAGDNEVELWLSTSENAANKQKLAFISGGYTNPRQWTKYATQQSALVTLQAGQRYYIEALHKEGTGGDNLAVGWQQPGAAAIT
ncbi:MAG: PA14 domain-containing protein, partial [Bacteroidota bacterium]